MATPGSGELSGQKARTARFWKWERAEALLGLVREKGQFPPEGKVERFCRGTQPCLFAGKPVTFLHFETFVSKRPVSEHAACPSWMSERCLPVTGSQRCVLVISGVTHSPRGLTWNNLVNTE